MELDLVTRAQQGDREAFTRLAAAMTPSFLSIAHRILRDVSLAEDATQLAMLNVWKGLPRLRDIERFEAWSHRLLVRACYTEGRRNRRWAPNLRLMLSSEPVAVDDLSSVVDRDQLERGFRRLSLDHRTVVVLYHFLDLPLERIAEICGIPTGTAHSRLYHAMRSLRSALDADLRAASREVS